MNQEQSGPELHNEGSNDDASQNVDMQDAREPQLSIGSRTNRPNVNTDSAHQPLQPLRPLLPNTLVPNARPSNAFASNPYAPNIQPQNPFGVNLDAASASSLGAYGYSPYDPNTALNPPMGFAPNIAPPPFSGHNSFALNPNAPVFLPPNRVSSSAIAGPSSSGFVPSQATFGSSSNQGPGHEQTPDDAGQTLQSSGRGSGTGAGVTTSRARAPSTRSQALLTDDV